MPSFCFFCFLGKITKIKASKSVDEISEAGGSAEPRVVSGINMSSNTDVIMWTPCQSTVGYLLLRTELAGRFLSSRVPGFLFRSGISPQAVGNQKNDYFIFFSSLDCKLSNWLMHWCKYWLMDSGKITKLIYSSDGLGFRWVGFVYCIRFHLPLGGGTDSLCRSRVTQQLLICRTWTALGIWYHSHIQHWAHVLFFCFFLMMMGLPVVDTSFICF